MTLAKILDYYSCLGVLEGKYSAIPQISKKEKE